MPTSPAGACDLFGRRETIRLPAAGRMPLAATRDRRLGLHAALPDDP